MATLPISGWDELYRNTREAKNMILSFSDGTTLRNSEIVMEQMSLEESLCSEENLRYGCCESSCFQIRIVNHEKSFEGLYLNVVQSFPPQFVRLIGSDDAYIIDDDGNYINGADMYFAKYGNFRVISDKPTGNRAYRDLICYDKMYDIIHANVFEWYNGLTFPMTVKDFRDSFFEYLNIQQVDVDLINDDFLVQGDFYVSEELSGRTVIESICEMNGAFGHMNRDGIFEYITLPSADTITYPHYVNGSCVYEDYETAEITGIRATNVEGDSGTVVGTEGNFYVMQSNIITFGSEGTPELMAALNNILEQIKDFTYTPFTVQTYGNPMLPLGTNVVFETRYKTINSFVMTRFLSGIQALRDTFTTLGDKQYPDDVNRIRNEIINSAGTTHKLVNDVNTLDSEIFDEHGNSRIQQTLNEIVLKVDSNGKLVMVHLGEDATLGSTFTINANFIDIQSNTIKFDNTGYSVKGSVFETIIKPDNFEIIASYPTDTFYKDYLPNRFYDVFKNIMSRYMGYNAYHAWYHDYEQHFPPDDPRYPSRFDELYEYSRTSTSNCILLSSPVSDAWWAKYWGSSGLHIRHEESEGWSESFFVIIGNHHVLFPGVLEEIIADGGSIDDDGYLVMPDNDKPLSYYMADQGYGHILSWGQHVISSDDYESIGYVKVHHEDFRNFDPDSGYDDVLFYGSDYLFAVAPVFSLSGDDFYDFSGYYWGKTSLGRTSLRGTINALLENKQGTYTDTASNTTGYVMHGRNTGHTYQCNWGSNLQFWVDVTNVANVSDRRLKEDIEEVNPNLVKAICECKTYQYKAFNRNGLISVGIIAQDFVANCEKYGIDPMDYEVCQKSIFKADDDTEYYYIEYSQYLTLKSIHLQNQIDELKELIKK